MGCSFLKRKSLERTGSVCVKIPRIRSLDEERLIGSFPVLLIQLLAGGTLRHRVAGGALSTQKVTEYASQISFGLAAAHEKGVIHRDLKPENIFITRDGRVKILDFRLAKPAPPLTPGDRTLATDAVKTHAGWVMARSDICRPSRGRRDR